MKEIWSKRYGHQSTQTNGLHNWLSKNIKNYKRSDLQKYLQGFPEWLGKPDKSPSVNIASGNFDKFKQYIKESNT